MSTARPSFIQRALLLLIFLSLSTSLLAQRSVGVQPRQPAGAKKRVALVIGNFAYTQIPALRNPGNDARDMAATLRKKGFTVSLLLNANRKKINQAIRNFGDRLRQGGVGLFYFAGHGVQVDGANYLIPIGADIKQEYEVQDEAVSANRILGMMKSAGNSLNMVFLDACRNNPYQGRFRSATKGLAAVSRTPKGSLISYATDAGAVAADGTGRNGTYTKNLLRYINEPGLELSQMMKRVRAGVERDTAGKQTPFELSSLTGDFYFSPIKAESAVVAFEPSSQGQIRREPKPANTINVEETFWKAIEKSSHPDDFQEYLKNYPTGRFAGLARLKMMQLRRTLKDSPPPKSRPLFTPGPKVRQPLDGRPVVIVDPSGKGDFSTISAAISSAKPGSVVRIKPGLYKETLSITKELHLEGGGRNRGEVVIEARDGNCLTFNTQIGSVKNMTFRLVGGKKFFCVDIRKGRLVLEGNDITSDGLASVGIRGEGTNPIVRGNRIHGSAQGGILVYENALGKIENNEIFQNKLAGIEIRQGADPLVIGNKIHHGRAGGILVQQKGKGRLEKNEIYKNYFTGIEIREKGDPLVIGNKIYEGRQSGIFVQKKGRGRIENNDIFGNKLGGVWVQTGGDPFVIDNRIYNNKPNDIIRKKTAKGVYRNNQKRF